MWADPCVGVQCPRRGRRRESCWTATTGATSSPATTSSSMGRCSSRWSTPHLVNQFLYSPGWNYSTVDKIFCYPSPRRKKERQNLKGLSHEIFGPVFWAVWMYLGPNVNRFSFLNFNGAPLILDNSFKFWCVSGQTISEILRISEKDW